jgi:hypothetical protein
VAKSPYDISEQEALRLVDYYFKTEKAEKNRGHLDLKAYCTLPSGQLFHKQYEFVNDPSRFITFDKSRRAGGTMALAGLFMHHASKTARLNLAYVTLDRGTAGS